MWNWQETYTDKKNVKVVAESQDINLTEAALATALTKANGTSFACKSTAVALTWVNTDASVKTMTDDQVNTVPAGVIPRFSIDKANATLKPASGLTCAFKLWTM